LLLNGSSLQIKILGYNHRYSVLKLLTLVLLAHGASVPPKTDMILLKFGLYKMRQKELGQLKVSVKVHYCPQQKIL